MSNQITPNPSVPTQIVQEVKFPKFVNNLGIIPTSYKDSMSYYECLAWLCKYLEETVIPTLNQNGEATQELQGLYIQLNDYVTNYFKNLDVTEEINNKLDEMADDGTLAEIIEDYATIPQLTSRVETLENITSERAIFIGDSYGLGTTNTSQTIDSWIVYLKQKLGLDNTNSYAFAEGGAGFVAQGTEAHNFRTLLTSNESSITHKESITKIIVCGGFNDRNQNSQSAIQSFVNHCKSNYPNAKVYIGMIGTTNEVSTNGNTYRYNLYNICLASYKRCTLYGATYLSGVENALKDYSYMSDDHQHPNADGYKSIASFIYNALNSGKNDFYSMQEATTLTLPSNASGGTVNVNAQRLGENTNIQILGNITFSSQTINTNSLILGTISSNYFRHTNHVNCLIPCVFNLIGSSTLHKTGLIRINGSNLLTLYFDDVSLTQFTEIEIVQCSLSFPTIGS